MIARRNPKKGPIALETIFRQYTLRFLLRSIVQAPEVIKSKMAVLEKTIADNFF